METDTATSLKMRVLGWPNTWSENSNKSKRVGLLKP